MDGLLGFVSVFLGVSLGGLFEGVIYLLLFCVRVLLCKWDFVCKYLVSMYYV